jgi:hypothetical protein
MDEHLPVQLVPVLNCRSILSGWSGATAYASRRSTTPYGKAMIQMAVVFAELEHGIIRAGLMAGIKRLREYRVKKLGRPQVPQKTEEAIQRHLRAGNGILKVAAIVGAGGARCSGSRRRWLFSWRRRREGKP